MGRKFEFSWGSPHPAGVHFLYADGLATSVRVLPFDIPTDVLQALLIPAGRETVSEL